MLTNSLIIFIATAVLWLTYRLLFRNSNQFQFNRFMLLSMTAFAFALPFVHIALPRQIAENATFTQSVPSYFMLREIVVGTHNAAPHSFDWMKLIDIIYIIGVIVFLAKLAYNILKIYTIAKKNEYTEIEGIKVVETGKEHIPYSFMNCIFMPKGETDPQILRHEMSHVRHHHSLDVLFIEIATAFQWFNPFMRLIKKDLQNIHEYTADRDVIDNGADKTDYMMLILQQCTASGISARPSASARIANNFSFSLTKKRIKMITKESKTKGLLWRALSVLPVVAVLLIANAKVTAQEKMDSKSFENESVDTIAQISLGGNSQSPCIIYENHILQLDADQMDFGGLDSASIFGYVVRQKEAKDPFTGEMKKVLSIENAPTGKINFKALGNNKFEVNMQNNDSIFQIVDEMPKFPGGEEGIIKFVATNVNYPEQAKDKSIEGRCFVGFIVEPDGSVSNVEIVRGVASAYEEEKPKALAQQCDEEAMRVVKSMPKWKPGMNEGKPVRVHYVLPISFKLK